MGFVSIEWWTGWAKSEFEDYGTFWLELMPRVRLVINPRFRELEEALDDERESLVWNREMHNEHFGLKRSDQIHQEEPPEFLLLIQTAGVWKVDRACRARVSDKGNAHVLIRSDKHRKWYHVFFSRPASHITDAKCEAVMGTFIK